MSFTTRHRPTRLAWLLLLVPGAAACVSAPEGHDAMVDELALSRPMARPVPAEPLEPGEAQEVAFDGELDGYVEYALREHPELLESWHAWRAATLRVDAVGRWPEPQLSYGYFVRSVETRVGPQRHRIGLMQPIPWPGKLSAAKEVADARAEALKRQHLARALVVRRRVEEVYWELWLIDRLHEWQLEQIALLEALTGSLRARLEVGRARLSDLNQVELRLTRVRDGLAGLEERARSARARFVAALGAPYTVATPIAPLPPDAPMRWEAELPPLEELVEAATAHPRIAAIAAMSEQSLREAELASKDRYPDFSLGVDYIETGSSPMTPEPEDSGKDPIIAMAGLRLPIWWGSYAAAEESAEAQSLAYRAQARSAQDQLVAELRQAVVRFQDARRRVALYETTLLPQAEAAYRSVVSGYETGEGQVASVLLAQRELLELQVGQAEAFAEAARALAAIEELTGRPVDVRPEVPPDAAPDAPAVDDAEEDAKEVKEVKEEEEEPVSPDERDDDGK